MSSFLLYIARSGIYLGIFHAFYLLVMRRITFFRLNRFLLVFGSAVCTLMPLFKVRASSLSLPANPIYVIGYKESVISAAKESVTTWPVILSTIYFLGVAVVALATVVSMIRMLRMIKSGEEKFVDGYRTVVLEGDHPSFTAGRRIVIGRKDLEENPAIFLHEKMHVRCRHYIDLLVFRVIQVAWWWNPLVWITRTELGLLHEYEADEAVLDCGVEASDYQMLLVRKAVGDERFVMASGFQHSNLKNRIGMMLRQKSAGALRWSYLAIVPFLSAALYAFNPSAAVPEMPEDDGEVVAFQLWEGAPTFNGGGINEFSKWVNARLVYPASAKVLGIQGSVIMSFTVDTDGSMKDIRVLSGVDPVLDAEALRVLKSCDTKWIPGFREGKEVAVTFSFPITFQLR